MWRAAGTRHGASCWCRGFECKRLAATIKSKIPLQVRSMSWSIGDMSLGTAAALLVMAMQSGILGPYIVQSVLPGARVTQATAKAVSDCKPVRHYGISGCELLISGGKRHCPSGYREEAVGPPNPMMKSPCYLMCVADRKGSSRRTQSGKRK